MMGPTAGEGKGFIVNVLSLEKQSRVIAALTEGCSVRATERLTDVQRKTIIRLGLNVGQGCQRLMDAMMRDLSVGVIELDEQWSFVGCKQKHVPQGDTERGDSWLFIALDATTKAVITYAVGKRTPQVTTALVNDLQARLLTRPQITADGFGAYYNAVPDAFGGQVDFAQLIKTFQSVTGNTAAVRYSPGAIRGVETKVVCGDPDKKKISTSYVERFNLSTRMHMRRFTRLTNAFSKKVENHTAAVGLHIAYYNLVRMHETLRCTPAMALGLTDHPWTIPELIEAALSAPAPAPVYTPPQMELKGLSAAKVKNENRGRTPRLRVLKGGRK